MRTFVKAFAMSVVAILVGTIVASAVQVFSDGANTGTNSANNIDLLGGSDTLAFGTGDDYVYFGSGDSAIDFTDDFFWNPTFKDGLYFENNTGSLDDDELEIRSDTVIIQSNKGDVVIQLGN